MEKSIKKYSFNTYEVFMHMMFKYFKYLKQKRNSPVFSINVTGQVVEYQISVKFILYSQEGQATINTQQKI